MAAITKTSSIGLFAWQDVSTLSTLISTPQDVRTKFSATVFGRIARRTGTAFTSGWPGIRIEASPKDSGDDCWVPVFQYTTNVGTAIANTTLNGTVVSGAQSFTVATSANIAAGDILYLGDTSSSRWELVRVRSVAGNVVTPEQAVAYDHANNAMVTDQAEMICAILDLLSITRLRAVVDNANSGQVIAVEFFMTTGDAIQ